jgi:hypothetical protein
MPEISSCFRSRTPSAVLMQEYSCKSLKIKMTGKAAGDSPHGEGNSRTSVKFCKKV